MLRDQVPFGESPAPVFDPDRKQRLPIGKPLHRAFSRSCCSAHHGGSLYCDRTLPLNSRAAALARRVRIVPYWWRLCAFMCASRSTPIAPGIRPRNPLTFDCALPHIPLAACLSLLLCCVPESLSPSVSQTEIRSAPIVRCRLTGVLVEIKHPTNFYQLIAHRTIRPIGQLHSGVFP